MLELLGRVDFAVSVFIVRNEEAPIAVQLCIIESMASISEIVPVAHVRALSVHQHGTAEKFFGILDPCRIVDAARGSTDATVEEIQQSILPDALVARDVVMSCRCICDASYIFDMRDTLWSHVSRILANDVCVTHAL